MSNWLLPDSEVSRLPFSSQPSGSGKKYVCISISLVERGVESLISDIKFDMVLSIVTATLFGFSIQNKKLQWF